MPNIDDNARSHEFRTKKSQEAYMLSLVEERKGYEARGLDDRAKAITEQLDELGYKREDDTEKADTRNVPHVEKADARNAPHTEKGASK